MPGGEVADFVGDDEPQGLGIACRAADLEQVGVDDDEAAEAVPRGEGVDLAVAQEHIGVGDAPQSEALGGLHHHPVALWELGRAHLHRGGAHLRVQERTRAPEDQRQQRHGQEDPAARRRAVADEEVAHILGKSSGGGTITSHTTSAAQAAIATTLTAALVHTSGISARWRSRRIPAGPWTVAPLSGRGRVGRTACAGSENVMPRP